MSHLKFCPCGLYVLRTCVLPARASRQGRATQVPKYMKYFSCRSSLAYSIFRTEDHTDVLAAPRMASEGEDGEKVKEDQRINPTTTQAADGHKSKKKKNTKEKKKARKAKTRDEDDIDVNMTSEKQKRSLSDDNMAEPHRGAKRQKNRTEKDLSVSAGDQKGHISESSDTNNNNADDADDDEALLAAAAAWADRREAPQPPASRRTRNNDVETVQSPASLNKMNSALTHEIKTFSLHITQLPYDTNELDIRKLFAEKGCSISSIRLVYDVDERGRKALFRGRSIRRCAGQGVIRPSCQVTSQMYNSRAEA